MLFQQGVLIDSINVQDNIALSLQAAGVTPSKDAIKEILSAVGIKDMHLHKMPNELSGGMLRRVVRHRATCSPCVCCVVLRVCSR